MASTFPKAKFPVIPAAALVELTGDLEVGERIRLGRRIAYLRWQRKLTQEKLAAQLQCRRVDISRMGVARIELGHVRVDEDVIVGLMKVFELPIAHLFPKEIRDLDALDTARLRKRRSRNAQG